RVDFVGEHCDSSLHVRRLEALSETSVFARKLPDCPATSQPRGSLFPQVGNLSNRSPSRTAQLQAMSARTSSLEIGVFSDTNFAGGFFFGFGVAGSSLFGLSAIAGGDSGAGEGADESSEASLDGRRLPPRSAIRAAWNGLIRRSVTAMTRSDLPATTSRSMTSRVVWLNFGCASEGLIAGSAGSGLGGRGGAPLAIRGKAPNRLFGLVGRPGPSP